MITSKVHGIIIRMTPYSEFDRVVGMFTEEKGLIFVYAKGVRRPRSKRSPHLDVLNDVTAEVEEIISSGETRRYLREIHTTRVHSHIKSDPALFAAACLIAYFIKRTVPENTPLPELLELTRNTFHALEEGKGLRETLKTFFLKTIRLLGLIPPTILESQLSETLWTILSDLDPQFTLHARRTLGTFSSAESTVSS